MISNRAQQIQLAGETDPSFATTLAKGLAVLEAFATGRSTLSNAEIASTTGLARPTVARLTQTLCELGYLRAAAERGKFRLWTRALSTAHPMLAEMRFRQTARPLMQELAESVRGAVSIGMLDGMNLIYIETARSGEPASHVPDIGFTAPLPVAAMGRALLGMLSETARVGLERRFEAELPELWVEHQAAVRKGIRDLDELGFCASHGHLRKETHAVGAPLFVDAADGNICFAINCGIQAFRLRPMELETEVGPRLVELAHAIRSAIGFSLPGSSKALHDRAPRGSDTMQYSAP